MSVIVSVNNEGNVVTPYEGNPEFGYIVLKSTESVFQNGWIQEKNRSTIMRGKTEMLERTVKAGQELPGKIAVIECLEDSIPAYLGTQLNKNVSFEEQIAQIVKRAGDGGPALLSGGKRILRFTEFDGSGKKEDIRVQHDNVGEIVAHNKDQKSTRLNSSHTRIK